MNPNLTIHVMALDIERTLRPRTRRLAAGRPISGGGEGPRGRRSIAVLAAVRSSLAAVLPRVAGADRARAGAVETAS